MAGKREKMNLIMICSLFFVKTDFVDSKLSDYTTICSAQDPKLNECFKQSAMQMLKTMTNGIPELGIPQIDPLQISNAFLEEPENGVFLTLSDPTIYDLSTAEITEARTEPENFKFYLQFRLKNQLITGTYKIKGKIFIMPLYGSGQINVTLTDVNILMGFSGKPEIKNKLLYMQLTNVSMSLEPKNAEIHLDNLFNGNKMLGRIMNNILNNNWEEMYLHMRPNLEYLCGDEIFKMMKAFLSQTPYHEIFHDLSI